MLLKSTAPGLSNGQRNARSQRTRLAGRPAEDSNMTSKRRRQIKIKFRAANDPGGERDLEAFVSKANLTLASLDEAEKVNEESLYWRVAPQKGRIKC
jgi:hypothetical protein